MMKTGLTQEIYEMLDERLRRPDWGELELYYQENDFSGKGTCLALIGYDLVGDRHVFPFRLPLWFYRLSLSQDELVTRIVNFVSGHLNALPRNLSPSA